MSTYAIQLASKTLLPYLEVLVACPESAVCAAIDAVVGDVQWRKQHDAVAVDTILDRESRIIHHVHQLLVLDIDVEQCGALLDSQALDVLRLACKVAQRVSSP